MVVDSGSHEKCVAQYSTAVACMLSLLGMESVRGMGDGLVDGE